MINSRYFLVFFSSLFFSAAVIAQSTTTTLSSETEVTYAKKLGTVNPVAQSKANTDYDSEKLKLSRRDFRTPKNFTNRFPKKIINEELEHTGPDKIRQSKIEVSKRPPIETVLNIEGLDNGNSPQDPSGDIGINYYVQAVNSTQIGIYNREGVLEEQFRTNSLWSEFNVTPGGDPIILFDQEAMRWTITEFPFTGNMLLVAISKTSDPKGDYDVYSFSTPRFPDYPKYSIWSNAYCLTTNEAGFDALHVYFINRQELLDGNENVRILRTSIDGPSSPEQPFIVATPVDWSGTSAPPADSNPIVLSLADASWSNNQTEDMINVNTFDIDWDNEDAIASLTQIPVSAYDSNPCAAEGFGFQCIPQQDGGGLDGLPEIITFQPHYRNFGIYEAIVFTFITDATDGDNIAGLRWTELRRTAGTDWALHQEGTFAPDDGLHRFMGSIALDGQGNIGMAYSTSSEDSYASIRYTGRLVGDALGEMTLAEQIAVEGSGTINAGGRFGDYPHITVDPVDNSTFWFTSEYAQGNSSSTRILAFKVAKQDFDISPVTIIQPQSSPDLSGDEIVRITVKNLGLNAVADYKVGYQFENGPIIENQINTELTPDEIFEYTFLPTIDLSEIGSYDLKVFTSYLLDNQKLNDTIYATITKQAKLDLGVFNISSTFPEVCGTETEIAYTLTNLGADDIINAEIEIKVNDVSVENFTHDNPIQAGQSIELFTNLKDLVDGGNSIEISATSPNGLADELPNNNTSLENINVIADGESITLNLTTDNYPNETSWDLLDSNGNVVYSSNGTLDGFQEQIILTNFCLDPEQCYTFVIYDDIGDGLTAFLSPSGSYQIYDDSGNIYAGIINADFGTEERNSFCVDYECNLEALALIEQGGAIIIEVVNGVGPAFEYSIDGGSVFQQSNIFENLEEGTYEIIVSDAQGCTVSVTATIPGSTALKKSDIEREITIYPNPTKGLIEIEVKGFHSNQLWVPISIYNTEGKKIQETTVAYYSGTYKGTVSLHHYPEGAYFVNFDFGDSNEMIKVIKQ